VAQVWGQDQPEKLLLIFASSRHNLAVVLAPVQTEPRSVTSYRGPAITMDPADGHEDLGRAQAALVPMGRRLVSQRFEGSRMRVSPHLRLVARHRGDLVLQSGGDVHPGVRDEGPWKRPLRTARSLECVDRSMNSSIGRVATSTASNKSPWSRLTSPPY